MLAGGRARPDIGPLFYEPTILDGVDAPMAVCTEETFGPVVSVYRFASTRTRRSRCANDTAYGLNSSVWTRDTPARPRGRRAAAGRHGQHQRGVRRRPTAASGAPMGGMKDSGLGRRHGSEGILKYTEVQTVAAQHG